MKYVHTNIISKDWKRLVDFYIAVFECTLVPPIRNQSGEWLSRGTGVTKAHLEGAHLRLPGHGDNGPTLEIYKYTEVLDQAVTHPNQKGYGHIAFEVEDVRKVLQKIEKNGGYKLGEVISHQVAGLGLITFTYARDPDGNIIELQHWDDH